MRRGGDSNPRGSSPGGFQDRCTKPLCDLSSRLCIVSKIFLDFIQRIIYSEDMSEAALQPQDQPQEPPQEPQQAPPPPIQQRPYDSNQPYQPMYANRYDPRVSHDVKTFLTWHAPGRPFKEHSKEYFINGFLIMMALEIILFLFAQYLLMLVVFSFVFLSYSLAIVPPKDFYYKITSEGIRIEDHVFIWEELYDFYFLTHHEEDTLHIRTKAYLPGELTITLGDISVGQIKKVLLPYLPYREYVRPNFTEQAGDWLTQNFPLERSTQ